MINIILLLLRVIIGTVAVDIFVSQHAMKNTLIWHVMWFYFSLNFEFWRESTPLRLLCRSIHFKKTILFVYFWGILIHIFLVVCYFEWWLFLSMAMFGGSIKIFCKYFYYFLVLIWDWNWNWNWNWNILLS